MAINFTDSPANGATQVIGGRTYTYNSAKNKWDTTATEVVGPTATVYATVDNLPGSATTGDQAFVSGTNRLYIWNGSGWYNIALINTNPTISGVSSSYDLATDGTATTVTITATALQLLLLQIMQMQVHLLLPSVPLMVSTLLQLPHHLHCSLRYKINDILLH